MTIANSSGTYYTKAITLNGSGGSISSIALTAGQRYALVYIEAGSTTAPQFRGAAMPAPALAALTPQIAKGSCASQADLPTTITSDGGQQVSVMLWMAIY